MPTDSHHVAMTARTRSSIAPASCGSTRSTSRSNCAAWRKTTDDEPSSSTAPRSTTRVPAGSSLPASSRPLRTASANSAGSPAAYKCRPRWLRTGRPAPVSSMTETSIRAWSPPPVNSPPTSARAVRPPNLLTSSTNALTRPGNSPTATPAEARRTPEGSSAASGSSVPIAARPRRGTSTVIIREVPARSSFATTARTPRTGQSRPGRSCGPEDAFQGPAHAHPHTTSHHPSGPPRSSREA